MATLRTISEKCECRISLPDANQKLGVSIASFNIPPVKTCGAMRKYCVDETGKRICYAEKMLRYHPSCRPAWERNLKIVKKIVKNQAFFELCLQISAFRDAGGRFFRIHSSGDFFDMAYLELWYSIIREFQDIKFLAFTKQFCYDYKKAPKNLRVVFSVMPGMDRDDITIPAGPRSYMIHRGADFESTYINLRRKRESRIECPGYCETCQACWNLRPSWAAVFHQH